MGQHRRMRAQTYFAAFLLVGVAIADSALDDKTAYLLTKREDNVSFVTAIARLTACKIPGPPGTLEGVQRPEQWYPVEAIQLRQQGRVVMELIFDPDWCVRKATIIQSSGFFRLDNASLEFAMSLKFTFKVTTLTDGQPTVEFPVEWKLKK